MHGPHMHGNGPSSHSRASIKKASFEVALKSKRQIAEGTMAFYFEKPQGFHFKAGQHVRMTLINPPETDEEGDSRFFSLASTPQDTDLAIAMRMRDTAFKRVLNRMHVGEKVLMQILLDVPHEAFALHRDGSKPAVMLAGGIGIVPLYSMIKDWAERKLSHKVFLFYSNRRPEDAPFLAELQQLAKQNPAFTLVATMTEADKSTVNWQGETGKIDRAMLTKYVTDLQSPMYYLAGLPEMTSTMKTTLTSSGVQEDTIHAEEFTGFNLNEINRVPNPTWKKHILFALVVLAVIIMIIVHAGAAVSISKSGFNLFSLRNPYLYLMIAGFIILIIFKLKHMPSFKHDKIFKLKRK